VSHPPLLHKLSSYVISGSLQKLIKSSLSNRQQCVQISSTLSEWTDVVSGVPKGANLAPYSSPSSSMTSLTPPSAQPSFLLTTQNTTPSTQTSPPTESNKTLQKKKKKKKRLD
ncbi:hypothetical protein CAPTEDRAFT_135236, partial [Capitella teleta]